MYHCFLFFPRSERFGGANLQPVGNQHLGDELPVRGRWLMGATPCEPQDDRYGYRDCDEGRKMMFADFSSGNCADDVNGWPNEVPQSGIQMVEIRAETLDARLGRGRDIVKLSRSTLRTSLWTQHGKCCTVQRDWNSYIHDVGIISGGGGGG